MAAQNGPKLATYSRIQRAQPGFRQKPKVSDDELRQLLFGCSFTQEALIEVDRQETESFVQIIQVLKKAYDQT